MATDNKQAVPEKGEGNHEADRRYREETKRFIESGRVGVAAEEAEQALESEADALEAAEEEGRSHIAEEDPEVKGRR
jgi:hypothetical protein